MTTLNCFDLSVTHYLNKLQRCFTSENISAIETLAEELLLAWKEGRNVFICGNGGSAANAIHIANDLHYGIGSCGPGPAIPGLNIVALTANSAIITCLANDTCYANIFAHQLQVKSNPGDLLIVLSGSGNSANVVEALKMAAKLELKSFAVLAFDGGLCKKLANTAIHFEIDDMQIAEDTQLLIGHLCMQWLGKMKPPELKPLIQVDLQ